MTDTEREEAAAKLAKAEARIAELEKAAAGEAGTKPPEVAKDALAGLSDEARKMVEESLAKSAASEARAQAAIEKAERLESERLDREYLTKAAEFAPVAKADEIAPILRAVDEKVSAEAGETLRRVLKGASEIHKASGLFRAQGSGGAGGGGDAFAQIEAAAAELRKADPKLTRAQAITKAAELNPELRKQHRDETREAVR